MLSLSKHLKPFGRSLSWVAEGLRVTELGKSKGPEVNADPAGEPQRYGVS